MNPSVSEIILQPGDILYAQGGPNDCGYIVESGEIILYSDFGGKRVDCERRGAGSIVGELSILTGQPRTVTVEALTRCKVYRISAEQIISRFDGLDPVLRACIETSINFTATFTKQTSTSKDDIPFAPSTLRNADELIERFRFETDLIKGLNAGEFTMVYQPIVTLPDGRPSGVEALMRWEHPILGNVAPDRFIQIAEKMGSIGQLSEFALTQACAALRRMRHSVEARDDFYVSVNVSGQDIGRPHFVDLLAQILDQYDLSPDLLKLEVTETALVVESEVTNRNLSGLRELGCGISIDDFGTGYSNLAYLKSLPLTALKIDRAFAGDACVNSVSRSIVRMLVTLGHELGADVVAEGLETAEDAEVLRDLGCRFAQGFFFHRPTSEAAIISLLDGADRDQLDVA